jgi:hypothetical protein
MTTPASPNTFVTPSAAPTPKYPSGYYVRIEGNSFLIIDMAKAAGTSPIPASCKERVGFVPELARWAAARRDKIISFIQVGCSREAIKKHIELMKKNLAEEEAKVKAKGNAIEPLTEEDRATVVELTQPQVDASIEAGLFRATGAGPTDTPSPADFREGQPTVIYGKAGSEFKHTMKEILALIVAESNEERRRELLKKLEHATA